jgi:hypothetical protein
MACRVGWRCVGELLMTRRISLVAFSRARLSVRRFSSSRRLEASLLGDVRAAESAGFGFDLAGFERLRFGLPLLFIEDRLGERAPEGKRRKGATA